MSLRRKLILAFGALAFIALVIVATSVVAGDRYARTDEQLQRHYARSLSVQRVRAFAFRAFAELPDAVYRGDPRAREQFDAPIQAALADFTRWARLADTPQERREVAQVRAAFRGLVTDAERALDAIADGRRASAERLVEGRLSRERIIAFEELTERAVAEDRRKRRVLRADAAEVRRTTQLVLLLAGFGALSVVLLIAAYLASDLFGPLRRLRDGLDRAARGDRDVRLDEGRADELGELHRSFDAMLAAVAEQESTATAPPAPRIDLHLVPVEVDALVLEVVDEIRAELRRRHVRLELALDPLAGRVRADRLRLREVVRELVRNALDALPETGGTLGLRTLRAPDGEHLHLEVADNGSGLAGSPGELLDPGRAGDGATTGLVASRAVVERHGGELVLDSRPGSGTLARVALPL